MLLQEAAHSWQHHGDDHPRQTLQSQSRGEACREKFSKLKETFYIFVDYNIIFLDASLYSQSSCHGIVKAVKLLTVKPVKLGCQAIKASKAVI